MSDAIVIVDDALSDAAIAAELERRRVRVSAAPAPVARPTVPALAWTLGTGRFAVPLAAIAGVSGAVRTTMVPGAPAALIGVFARRGVIHTLFDPARVLGMAAGGAGDAGAVILLRQDRPRIAIRVDAASGVIALPHATEPADLLTRIVVLADGSAVSVVDTARLIGHLTGQPLSPDPEG